MIGASTICPAAGCRTIVRGGGRCERHQKQQRSNKQYEKRRGSFRERGYTTSWTNLSERYRQEHPLCVPCLAQGRVKPAQCVDHIIPVGCCPQLVLDWDNCQSACTHCNTQKRFTDPKESWTPNHSRIVVCGLPGTGKTTYAKSTGHPYWDTDEHPELSTIEQVQQARNKWVSAINPMLPCVVIVGSTLTAPHVALQLRGVVKHMTERYIVRPPHALWGQV